ncbi:MAG TPA: hypothetical protein VD790_09370 [Thermoleophilaceae bacterium]|nr:hypothetical protein [Thermoleophilaceae bacterium]
MTAAAPSRPIGLRAFAIALALVCLGLAVGAAPAEADQASDPATVASGQIDAGGNHTCAVLDNGTVRCWGQGDFGQLGYANTSRIGDDETPGSVGPVNLGAGRTATAITAGNQHTCALLDNATVRCWGDGANGRLGYANTTSIGDNETPGSVGPVNLGAGRTATAITAGDQHTCALLDNGTVRCWGRGADGRLGYANTDTVGDDETPGSVGPVDLGAGRTATAITAGFAHTCAVLDNRTVRCWGASFAGQLGYANTNSIGDDETPSSVGPVDLGAGRTATAITTGFVHTCALLDNGTVRCWGDSPDGRLGYANTARIGDNETPASVGPVDLGAGRTATAIAAGNQHTCAVLDNGTVRCWGEGFFGSVGYANTARIGDNETPGSVGPVDLGAGRTATAITAGGFHTCAVLDNGTVRCWGRGFFGQLGYANTNDIGDTETPGSVGPVSLGGSVGPRDPLEGYIAAGNAHTCALLDDGAVRCWGNGGNGQLGYANTDTIGDNETPGSAGPVDLGPGRTATAITAGDQHTCALLDDGSVRCWGSGSLGRLGYANTTTIGDNETPGSVGPVDLGAGSTATAITAGGGHTCAVLDDGSVRCWGFGGGGRLGYANTTSIGDTETPGSVGPVDLGAGRTATAITAGGSHTCAELDDGAVRCWGVGASGRLGYANTTNIGDTETPGSVGPVDLGAGRTATAITAGGSHTCAELNNGAVRCWGNGGNGQLGYANTDTIGDNETPGSVGPVDLGPGRTATAITAGNQHTCAVLDNGTVRCWGNGGNGQLGYANTTTIGDDETPGTVGPVDLGGSVGPVVDTVAPTTTDNVPASFQGSAVTITLTATDTGSGVKQVNGRDAIYYTVGSSPAVPTTASAQYDPANKPTLTHGQRIRYFAIDAADNAETPHSSDAAKVDTAAPTSSDDVPAGFRNGPVTVTLSATDNPTSAGDFAGVKQVNGRDAIYYTVGSSPAVPTTASAQYDPANKPTLSHGQKIRYFAVDAVDNAETAKTSAAAQVDTQAPSTTDDVPASFQGATVTVTLTASDEPGGSGVDKTYYTTGTNPADPTTSSDEYDPADKPTLGHGEVIKYFSTDIAGNAEAVKTSAAAKVDSTAPSTTDDVPAGWGQEPVEVTLTATDELGGSGVDKTYYTTGTSPADPTTSSEEYDPAAKPTLGNGEVIRYFSTDLAGNAEAVKTSAAAKVDNVAPETSDDVPAGWRQSPVEVTLTATDDRSGVATTYYSVGTAPTDPLEPFEVYDPAAKPVLADGEMIEYFSIDNAGNTEPVRTSPKAKVDQVAPETSDDVPSGEVDGPVAVTLSATDAGSGVTATYYTTGVSPADPTTGSAVYDPGAKPVLADGEVIKYFSVDLAGNAEAVKSSQAVGVDTAAPSTADDVPADWRQAPVEVALTATDDDSGVDKTYYTTGVSPADPTTGSAVYDPGAKPTLADGEVIKYFSVDQVGNAEAVRTSRAAKVDPTAPSTTDDVPSGVVGAPVVVTLSAEDAGSGVTDTYYTTGVSPADPTTSSAVYDPGAKPVLADGEVIKYFSVDLAGNAEAVKTSTAVDVDSVAPSTTDDVSLDWQTAPVEVTLAATDGDSGIADTYYTTGVSPADPTTASAVYDPAAKPVLGDGEVIKYFSVDEVGNAEAVRTSPAAQVDQVAPSTSDDVPSGEVDGPVTVVLSATDTGSGVAHTYYTSGASPADPTSSSAVYDPAAKPTLGDGERVKYFSVDLAGNAEAVKTSAAVDVADDEEEPPPGPKPGACANDLDAPAGGDPVFGSSAGDWIRGTDTADRLVGLAGDDCLEGRGGDDTLFGNDGDDRFWAGAGDDNAYGRAGEDRLWGDTGDDLLSGGDDTDALRGRAGKDRLKGGSGPDRLYGGADDDRLRGGPATNTYSAGRGDDRVRAANGQAETIRCGPGEDHATADADDTTIDCETVNAP